MKRRRSAGSRRIRLIDVASRAGVSTALVSSVLRNVGRTTIRVSAPTAQRIRRIASELDYRPDLVAQQMRGAMSSTIGVLIGAESPQSNFRRLAALEHRAFAHGRRLMIGHFHQASDNTADYLQDFLDRRIDRVLCFGNPSPVPNRAAMAMLRQFSVCVFQGTAPEIPNACAVDVDRHAGQAMAYAHLVRRRRKRIALLINDLPASDPMMKERYVGYRAAVESSGRAIERGLIWTGNGTYPPPRDLVDEAVRSLLAHQTDAVIASNDVWAIEVIKGLRRAGQSVPRDVAVIGADNLEAASLFDPGVTTIDPSYDDFARVATDLLLSDGQGDRFRGRRHLVAPKLVIRESA